MNSPFKLTCIHKSMDKAAPNLRENVYRTLAHLCKDALDLIWFPLMSICFGRYSIHHTCHLRAQCFDQRPRHDTLDVHKTAVTLKPSNKIIGCWGHTLLPKHMSCQEWPVLLALICRHIRVSMYETFPKCITRLMCIIWRASQAHLPSESYPASQHIFHHVWLPPISIHVSKKLKLKSIRLTILWYHLVEQQLQQP